MPLLKFNENKSNATSVVQFIFWTICLNNEIIAGLIFGKAQQNRCTPAIVINHKGAKDFPVQMQNYLKKEKSHGAILGPYKQNPFCCNIAVSPLNSVPKKETDERRIILDPSFSKGSSINEFVSKGFYLGDKVNLTYPWVDDFVEIIKRKGQGCLLFKRDLARAYKLIVLDPGNVSLLGYSFNGEF